MWTLEYRAAKGMKFKLWMGPAGGNCVRWRSEFDYRDVVLLITLVDCGCLYRIVI